VLEANILKNASVAEARRFMQPDRCTLLGGVAYHRDHLPEADSNRRLDKRRQ